MVKIVYHHKVLVPVSLTCLFVVVVVVVAW